jgi:hypothetical protein
MEHPLGKGLALQNFRLSSDAQGVSVPMKVNEHRDFGVLLL